MVKSRNNFYYDLSQSPNKITIRGYTFVFPSVKRLSMFQNKLEEHTNRLTRYLMQSFHLDVDCELMGAFSLYDIIQGASQSQYVIMPTGEVITWLPSLKFDGRILNFDS